MIKIKSNLKSKINRIKKIPIYTLKTVKAKTKKDALAVIKEFQDGLMKNNFGLEPLNPKTVNIKTEAGMQYPKRPLVGKGEDENRSYMNMLELHELKNGYSIRKSHAKHWKANLKLRDLFTIHEYGTIIHVTEKMRAYLHVIGIHLKPTTMMIRIPARPAFKKAYDRALRKRKDYQFDKDVKKASNQFINTGNEKLFKVINERLLKGEI